MVSPVKNIIKPPQRIKKGICKIHGRYESKETKSFSGNWVGGKCPKCCVDKKKQDSLNDALFNTHLPKRFQQCTFNNFILGGSALQAQVLNECKSYAENFKKAKQAGASMALVGTCGTGKTHIASAITNHVIGHKLGSCKFTKVYDMMADIKSTWSSKSRTEEDAMKEYTKPDLLIIDEIGVQFGSDTEELLLFRILNKRYEDMKSVIIISNLNEEGLIKYLGERVVDRLYEGGGGLLAFDWESYRRVRT